MSKTRRIEFLERLANLMQEYDAEIEVDGDGCEFIDGQVLVINVLGKQVYSCNYLSFDSNDIKQHVKQIKEDMKNAYEKSR